MMTEETKEDHKEETQDIHMDIFITKLDEENQQKKVQILSEENFKLSECSSSESDLPL